MNLERAVEVSCGGVVRRGDEVVLVRTKTLAGELVWTFPKGHVEDGESAEQTALREVLEETGWRCAILGVMREVRYSFERDGRPVDKTVHWFEMTPEEQVGAPDPEEIFGLRWASRDAARGLLTYPSDLELLEAVFS